MNFTRSKKSIEIGLKEVVIGGIIILVMFIILFAIINNMFSGLK